MLRLLVLLLVLANAGYYAWGRGLLAPYGFGPLAQAEPQRMAQQIRPEALRVLTPFEARQIEGPAPASAPALVAASTLASTPSSSASTVECLQVGIFNEEQTVVLRERLISSLPAGKAMTRRSRSTTVCSSLKRPICRHSVAVDAAADDKACEAA